MGQIVVASPVGIAFVVFAFAVMYTSSQLKDEVPQEDREFLDPLPKILRVMWPVVRFVDYHVCQLLTDKYIADPRSRSDSRVCSIS